MVAFGVRWGGGEEKEMDFAVDVEVEQRRCIQCFNRLVAFQCNVLY